MAGRKKDPFMIEVVERLKRTYPDASYEDISNLKALFVKLFDFGKVMSKHDEREREAFFEICRKFYAGEFAKTGSKQRHQENVLAGIRHPVTVPLGVVHVIGAETDVYVPLLDGDRVLVGDEIRSGHGDQELAFGDG